MVSKPHSRSLYVQRSMNEYRKHSAPLQLNNYCTASAIPQHPPPAAAVERSTTAPSTHRGNTPPRVAPTARSPGVVDPQHGRRPQAQRPEADPPTAPRSEPVPLAQRWRAGRGETPRGRSRRAGSAGTSTAAPGPRRAAAAAGSRPCSRSLSAAAPSARSARPASGAVRQNARKLQWSLNARARRSARPRPRAAGRARAPR